MLQILNPVDDAMLQACNSFQARLVISMAAGKTSTNGRSECDAGRAASYLKQQQQLISDGPYAKLKPLALAASKGTLERLSKLPGWKRQSARKK